MAQSTIDRARGNDSTPVADAPAIEPPRRRTRLPELAIGIVLIVTCALAAVLWHTSSTSREAVLTLASDIERGETIDAADLRVVFLDSDDPVATMSESASGSVVGRIAVADLEAGTLLTPSQFTERSTLSAGDGVVGLALDPGQFPALGLLPGDRVNVVAAAQAADASDAAESSPVLAAGAEVFAVEDLGNQGRQFVSLRMPESDANLVAAAAERGPVRLVLVGS